MDQMVRAVAASGFVALAICALFIAAIATHVSAIEAPFWDHWGYTDPHETLSHLFRPHNEHPHATGKIVFLIDYYLSSANGELNRAMLWLELAMASVAILALAWLAGIRDTLSLCAIAAATICSLFSAFAWENLRWGFVVSWIAGLAGPTVAIAAVAAFAVERRTPLLWLAYCGLIAGIFGAASALFTPFLVLAMAIALRLGPRVYAGLIVTAAVGWISYLAFRQGSSSDLSAALANPDAVIAYAIHYLGGLYGTAIHYWSYFGIAVPNALPAASFAGALLIITNLGLTAWLIAKRQINPGIIGLIALSAMCFMTAILTGIGRAGFEPEQALSSRYGLSGGLLLGATVTLGFVAMREIKLSAAAVALLSGSAVIVLLLFMAADVPLLRNLMGRHLEEFSGQTALITGVSDESAIKKIAADADYAMARSPPLKAAGKYHFANVWARRVGTALPLAGQTRGCRGEISKAVAAGSGGMRLQGVAQLRRTARDIVMVDKEGTIVGYGRIPPMPSDFYSFLRAPERAAWYGHLRAASLDGVTGFLAGPDGAVCRLW